MLLFYEIYNSISYFDQENIGREAMAMITEITKSNILYEKNKSSANLAFAEQKFNDREKQNKETNKRYFIGNYTDIAIQGKAIVTVT